MFLPGSPVVVINVPEGSIQLVPSVEVPYGTERTVPFRASVPETVVTLPAERFSDAVSGAVIPDTGSRGFDPPLPAPRTMDPKGAARDPDWTMLDAYIASDPPAERGSAELPCCRRVMLPGTPPEERASPVPAS